MLDSFPAVERALGRYADPFQPRGGSVAVLHRRAGEGRFPFHPALLDELEEREELRRRMAALSPTDAVVLVRWYVEGALPEAIARDLRCSRRHVYRRRRAAVAALVEAGAGGDDLADADVSEFV